MRHPPVLGLIFSVVLAFGAVPAAASVLITVDKSTQQMDVSVDGVHRWTWPVSTGVPQYDTPSGTYRAFRMEADHFSKEWDDAPMPHSIFFTPKGHAIHGYLNTSHIGSPASHGCVRLSDTHAAQLYALVQQQGVTNATVVLTGDVRVAMAGAATRMAARNAGTVAEAMPGPPQTRQPQGYGYDAARSAPYDQQPRPDYGYQQPQYGGSPRAEYGRTYDNCPLPPPGFPTPACAEARMRGLQARADRRADQYAPRRYDYGQPQYEPDQSSSSFGRPRSPY